MLEMRYFNNHGGDEFIRDFHACKLLSKIRNAMWLLLIGTGTFEVLCSDYFLTILQSKPPTPWFILGHFPIRKMSLGSYATLVKDKCKLTAEKFLNYFN